MTIEEELSKNFKYEEETTLWDNWKVITDPNGAVSGDCEDYSLTLIYRLEGYSWVNFWLSILTFKYIGWYCKVGGNGHFVLWGRGKGWIDNRRDRMWTTRKGLGDTYKLKYPYLLPLFVLKMVLASMLRIFKKDKN